MNPTGWIKFHRQFLKWEWYSDINVSRLYLHLLLKANYEPSKFRGKTIGAGQLVTGRIALSDETGLTQQQIRTALNKLKSTSNITIKANNKYSIISITCWEEYQEFDAQSTSNPPNEQPTSNQQVTTSKEVKKNKKVRSVNRACRISADWTLNDKGYEFALGKGFVNGQISTLAESFLNHWLQQPDSKAKKVDWDATWRTWVNNDIKWNGSPKESKSGSGFGEALAELNEIGKRQ